MVQRAEHNRPLSIIGAWALCFGSAVGWGVFIMPGTSFLPNAGSLGTAIALAIGAVAMSFIAVNYHYLIKKFPRCGGAFVYAQETFGHTHGFICGWLLLLSFLPLVAMNATASALISRNLLGGIAEFGFSYSLAGYQVYFGEILLMLLLCAVVMIVLIRSNRLTYAFQTVFVLCMAIFTVAVLVVILRDPAENVAAMQPAFSPDKEPVFGSLVVLSLAPWAFIGFEMVSQTADEARFPIRKSLAIMVCAISFSLVMYVAVNSLAAMVTPAQFDGWPAYVAASGDLSGIEAVPAFNAVATVFGPYGMIMLDVVAFGAILSGMVGFSIGTSRVMAAMAEGGHLPAWLGSRHPKYGTPVHAIVITFLAVAAFLLAGRSVLSWIVDMSSVGAAVAFFYTSLAAARHARREGRWGLVVSGGVGIALSVAFIALLLVPISQVGAHLEVEGVVFLIAWVALGLNFYLPKHHARTHLDFDEHYSAIDSDVEAEGANAPD